MHNWTRLRPQVQIEPEKDVLLVAGIEWLTFVARYFVNITLKLICYARFP